MKVTLRKAAVFQSAVSNLIDEVTVRPTVSVNDEVSVEEELTTANDEFRNDLRRIRDLVKVKFSLRKKIGLENHTSGVSALLTEEREISELMHELERVVDRTDNRYYSAEQIQAKFDKHNQKAALSGSSYMSRSITVETDLLKKEEVIALRKEILALKRARQATNDRVLEINVSTRITLSDDEVKLLTDEGLI